jgi:dTDP-D-glucose 4,6-dehydratase
MQIALKLKKLLNWKPKIKLDEGLKKTIKWMSENIDRYNNLLAILNIDTKRLNDK